MSKSVYGIVAGVVGVGLWLLARRRVTSTSREDRHGRVVFRNTPEPTPLSSEGLI